jgi:hypothetical protein
MELRRRSFRTAAGCVPNHRCHCGLDPAIHRLRKDFLRRRWMRGSSPRMTNERQGRPGTISCTILPRSRGAFLRPGVCDFASPTPNRGVGGAPRNVRVLGGTPAGRIMTRYARRLARRLASHDAGRSPLGAPPWRFWAPGPRFSHWHLRRIGYSELLAPRS